MILSCIFVNLRKQAKVVGANCWISNDKPQIRTHLWCKRLQLLRPTGFRVEIEDSVDIWLQIKLIRSSFYQSTLLLAKLLSTNQIFNMLVSKTLVSLPENKTADYILTILNSTRTHCYSNICHAYTKSIITNYCSLE